MSMCVVDVCAQQVASTLHIRHLRVISSLGCALQYESMRAVGGVIKLWRLDLSGGSLP